MDKKIEHLKLIETVVERMARCSFLVRGWGVTIVAAIFALAAKDADRRFFLIAYFPIVAFWILDSYYLAQERMFRKIYDCVRKKSDDQIDFAMGAAFNTLVWAQAALSVTVIIFWGVLVMATVVVMFTVVVQPRLEIRPPKAVGKSALPNNTVDWTPHGSAVALCSSPFA